MSLKLLHLPGLARAATPIVHGEPPEQTARRTNHTPVRRIPYALADGRLVAMPVVSGNAVRGMTRRRFIDRTLATLDAYDVLDRHVAYFLLAGGATGQGTASIGGPEFRKELRENLPFVDLLGGSLRGCFVPGRLRVGFMTPVTKETLETEPIAAKYGRFDPESLPSYLDFTSVIATRPLRLTRYDEGIFRPDEVEEEENGAAEETAAEEAGEGGRARVRQSGRMVYSAEVFPVNTWFVHYFNLVWAPAPTLAAFWAFVECFLERGEVGGWHAKGCGRVEPRYFDAASGDEVLGHVKKEAAAYWKYLEENKAAIRSYLEQLGPRVEAMAKEAVEKKAAEKKESARRGRRR